MAKENINNVLASLIKAGKTPGKAGRKLKEALRLEVGLAFHTTCRIPITTFGNEMAKGIEKILGNYEKHLDADLIREIKAVNTEATWKTATTNVIASKKYRSKSIHTEETEGQFIVTIEHDAEHRGYNTMRNTLTQFRREVRIKWQDNTGIKEKLKGLATAIGPHVPKGISGKKQTGAEYIDIVQGRQTEFVHDKSSTIPIASAARALEQELKDSTYQYLSDIGYKTTNFVDEILSACELEWKWEEKMIGTKMVQFRTVTGRIQEGPQKKEITDFGKRKGKPDIIATITKVLGQELAKIKGLTDVKDQYKLVEFEASTPFTSKIANSEIRKMADQYLKAAGYTKGGIKIKVKNIPPKPKGVSKQGRVSSKRKPRSKLSKIVIAKAASTIKIGPEKGAGKAASTSKAADLLRLKTYINKRLPAEVRRNMGRPALINRTGRFSNSVRLLQLSPAKQTMMAKYTYLLSPYETFENTGRQRWPLAYNPKTVIAKSIRNLAMGRISQKLTVRRV